MYQGRNLAYAPGMSVINVFVRPLLRKYPLIGYSRIGWTLPAAAI